MYRKDKIWHFNYLLLVIFEQVVQFYCPRIFIGAMINMVLNQIVSYVVVAFLVMLDAISSLCNDSQMRSL